MTTTSTSSRDVFAQRTAQSSRLYDSEIDALKAAAKRQDEQQQQQARAENADKGRAADGVTTSTTPARSPARSPAGASDKLTSRARGGGPVIEMPVVEG